MYVDLASREPRPTTTYTIAKDDRERLQRQFGSIGGIHQPLGPYEAWRVRLSDGASQATAIMYQSGKLVIAGHAPAFDQAVAIAEAVGKAVAAKRPSPAPSTAAPVQAPSENEPHIGTDEAGKGDFFGPLVTAGVYVDERTAQLLRALGVRDSKLVSDRELRGLARNIRDVVEDDKRAVIIVAPKRYIENRLMVDTRLSGVPVIQMHRAEADVGVAAASILARDAFLGWLEQAGKRLGLTVPKGASPKVIQTGKLLVGRMGADGLKDYAKVSFKTMNQIVPGSGPVA